MNIDELKDAWSDDEPTGMQLPLGADMLGKSTSAISKIRKNMKAEFIALLISYIIIVLFLFKGVRSPLFFNVTCILLFCIIILNCFYYFRFYVFYRSIGRYDLDLKNSIGKIVYELELNTEIYKTYSFSAVPLSIFAAIALIASKINFANSDILTASGFISLNVMLWIYATILLSFIITYFFINLHVRLTYGKYLAELKQVMTDLGE